MDRETLQVRRESLSEQVAKADAAIRQHQAAIGNLQAGMLKAQGAMILIDELLAVEEPTPIRRKASD